MLELRDRAYALLSTAGPHGDEALLAHVYGGAPPTALHARLLAPLAEDPRLVRSSDGLWTVARAAPVHVQPNEFTALALTTTGPNPARARVVRVTALHVADGAVVERFSATVNPETRVPRYVAERAGLEPEQLNGLGPFRSILDELTRFLGDRPIYAQEVQRVWQFLSAEARLAGCTLREPPLVDVNEVARALELPAKPTLALVARHLQIGFTSIERADEEARIISLVVPHLPHLPGPSAGPRGQALQRADTAQAVPDTPGIYVMRDEHQAAVYVGKARRLRERLGAYIHRPLGATRRLEGLASAVHAVETQECATDLEALILEEREIRRLQPRFNTVRRQHAVRTWIRLPPWPTRPRLAPPRLELASGPELGPGEYIGPFRTEMAADQARVLARVVFDLDALRTSDRERYVESLTGALAFLRGELDEALARARTAHAHAVSAGDARAARLWQQRLTAVGTYDPSALFLPADPRHARYAVARPGPSGIEVFVLDAALLLGWGVLEDDDDPRALAERVLEYTAPRTTPAETDVVLRWLAAQRSSARLVLLPPDALTAADAIEDAVVALLSLFDVDLA